MRSVLLFLLRGIGASIVIFTFFVLIQDFLIFPGLAGSWQFYGERDPKTLPPAVESIFVSTEDGEKLETWRLGASEKSTSKKQVAIIFHGNAGTVASFHGIQKWLSSIGLVTYGVDYRGFGYSTGWPSEQGFNLDVEAVFREVMTREQVLPEHILAVGISVGTGPAIYAAKNLKTKAVLLLSPYTSLPDVARDSSPIGFLRHFMWWDFPNLERLSNYHGCIVAAHGIRDSIIPYSHTKKLQASYSGQGSFNAIFVKEAGHGDMLIYAYDEITNAVRACIEE